MTRATLNRVHIGKKVPKGYIELPGSFHMGRGVWAFQIAKKCEFKDERGLECRRIADHPGAHHV